MTSAEAAIIDKKNPCLYANAISIDEGILASLIKFIYRHYNEFWHNSNADTVAVYNAWVSSEHVPPLSADNALFLYDYISRVRTEDDAAVLCQLAGIDMASL